MIPSADAGSCPAAPPATGAACAYTGPPCLYGTMSCFCSGISSGWLCTSPPQRG
jgi:hypothetical protein